MAVLKQQYDEIEYVKQIYCLGMFYNKALIGPETNFSTYPIQKLVELNYQNLYVRKKEDTYISKHEKSFGFKTTAITRPLILANLQEIVKDEIDKIYDKDTLKEMLTFIVNKNGRAEAEEGYHDDLVMGLAIAYYIRPQQAMKKIKTENEQLDENIFKEFGQDNEYIEDDYGSRIEVF